MVKQLPPMVADVGKTFCCGKLFDYQYDNAVAYGKVTMDYKGSLDSGAV